MKNRTTGRIARGVPISMLPEDLKFVDGEVKRLKRRVGSRSNYVQQLIEMDRICHLIENGLAVVQARMLSNKARGK